MNLDWQSFWVGAGCWAVFVSLMSWILNRKPEVHLTICDCCKEKLNEGPYR
jgi:hypothetical protein